MSDGTRWDSRLVVAFAEAVARGIPGMRMVLTGPDHRGKRTLASLACRDGVDAMVVTPSDRHYPCVSQIREFCEASDPVRRMSGASQMPKIVVLHSVDMMPDDAQRRLAGIVDAHRSVAFVATTPHPGSVVKPLMEPFLRVPIPAPETRAMESMLEGRFGAEASRVRSTYATDPGRTSMDVAISDAVSAAAGLPPPEHRGGPALEAVRALYVAARSRPRSLPEWGDAVVDLLGALSSAESNLSTCRSSGKGVHAAALSDAASAVLEMTRRT